MTARQFKIGYRKCTASDCDHPVHYMVKQCPSCGAVQVRAPKTAADSPSVGKSSEKAVPQVHTTPPAAADGPYVVMADCRPQLGNVMAVLKKGAVVTDYQTILALLAAGAPIVPQNEGHGLVCCPRCQNIFAPTALAPTKQRQAG
jgi:uncharacterized C2H2 Zn-finger protein